MTARRVLAVMAHPDDAELLCFGTLLKLCRQGWAAKVVMVSDGGYGVAIGAQGLAEPLELASLRMNESRCAFAESTVQLEQLKFEDGKISANRRLISAIEAVILDFSPEVVITHYADSSGFDHQDHRAVAMCVANAITRHACVRRLMLAEPILDIASFRPNHFVDITELFALKVAALTCHRSQSGRGYLTEDFHRHRSRCNARRAGLLHFESGRLFEAFEVAKDVVF